jgi:hypothetical protein
LFCDFCMQNVILQPFLENVRSLRDLSRVPSILSSFRAKDSLFIRNLQLIVSNFCFVNRLIHSLVHVFFNPFSSWWLNCIQIGWMRARLSLTFKQITFRVIARFTFRAECLTHICVALIFLVDKVVGGGYLIVSVRFKTADRVFFIVLKVNYQSLKQIFSPGHLLGPR